jgi:hypothetical protein
MKCNYLFSARVNALFSFFFFSSFVFSSSSSSLFSVLLALADEYILCVPRLFIFLLLNGACFLCVGVQRKWRRTCTSDNHLLILLLRATATFSITRILYIKTKGREKATTSYFYSSARVACTAAATRSWRRNSGSCSNRNSVRRDRSTTRL